MAQSEGVPRDEPSMLASIGVSTSADEPSYFDLLSLTPQETDAALIKKRAQERTSALRKYAGYKKDPQVQKLANDLMARVAKAGKVLADPKRRAEYQKGLRDAGKSAFRKRIAASITADQELTAAQRAALARLAGEYGLTDDEASEVIDALLAAGQNRFTPLGVAREAEDPCWPTAFDLLGLPEGAPEPERVEQAFAQQSRRLEAADLTPAEKHVLRRYLDEASRMLATTDSVRLYLASLQRRRSDEFRRRLGLALSSGQAVDQRAAIRLLGQARRMRLSVDTARKVLGDLIGRTVEADTEPVLAVIPPVLETQVLPDGTGAQLVMSVLNQGGGTLEVTSFVTPPWLKIATRRAKVPTSQDIRLQILPGKLKPGRVCEGEVEVHSDGGQARVTVRAVLGFAELPHDQELDLARQAYLMVYLWILGFLHWPYLLKMFFDHRNRSSFVAYHAMQALLTWFISMLGLGVLAVTQALIDTKSSPSCGMVCGVCLLWLIVLAGVFGWPIMMVGWLDEDETVVVPGAGQLAKLTL